ncbi:MAG TPA: O-antigen ligase family protein [Chloroflexota bacterium]
MIGLSARPMAAIPRRAAAVAAGALAGLGVGAIVAAAGAPYAIVGLLALGLVVGACLLPVGRFWLLAGVVTLLPFAAVPRLGIQPTLLDGVLGLLLLVAFARQLLRLQAGVSTPLDVPILAFLVLCCVSFVFGSAYGVTSDTAKYFLRVVAAVLLFFALTNGLTTRGRLASFVDALILGSFGSAVLAVVLYLAGQDTTMRVLSSLGPLGYPTGLDTLRFIASTNIWRATSTSVDPNIFGGLLMTGMLLLLGRLMARPSRRAWLLGAPLLAAMGWALLLSYSRGAWVGFAAGVLFLALMRYRKALPAVALAAIVAVVALGNTDFGKHLVSGFLVEDKASAMRLGEYKDAVNFISEYPFFGVGFGTTPNGSAITPEADIYVGVSNIYLLMALEVGLVGTAAFAVVLGTLGVWTARRYKQADVEGKAWLAAGSAALFAAAVAGIADHYFFRFPHMIALFWTLVAILAIACRLSQPPIRTA